MNQKKAFTLVELLAVIVVLAILAVITVPIVINTIAEAEKGAFLSSVDSYTRAVRTEYIIDSLNQKNSITEFLITNGKVNGNTLLNNEKVDYNGIINFDLSNNSYFLMIKDKKYCAYKNYGDLKPEIVDIKKCDVDVIGGIYTPIIEVEKENELTPTKKIVINFINNKNKNEYCIGDINGEPCSNFISVDTSKVEFEIDKEAIIYAKESNNDKELITKKTVSNIGIEIKKPVINSLSLTIGENDITATITSEAFNSAKIEKYYFKIDNNDYIESDLPYYTFKDLTPTVNHVITVYVLDSNGYKSDEKSTAGKTNYVDKNPIINSLSLTSDKNDITALVNAKAYTGSKIDKFYFRIDGKDYISQETSMYKFTNLEPGIEHLIDVYVEDSMGRASQVTSATAKTLYEEKNPEIISLSLSQGTDLIVATVNAKAYGGSKITNYYYSIDDKAYVSSTEPNYYFKDVEPFVEHTIKVYVKDDEKRESEIVSSKGKTTKSHTSPSVDAISTTIGDTDITITPTVSVHDNATITKYCYSIDNEPCIETTATYYKFSEITDNITHRFSVYVIDSMGVKSNTLSITAVTATAVPELTIVVNNPGYEYNGEIWYPSGTIITLNYSPDMTGKKGYYQSVNVSTGTESTWQSNAANRTRNIKLSESYIYRIKIINSDNTESKVLEKKINIMPNPNTTNGVPSNYYKYNMGGIYPVYIKEGSYAQTTGIKGTDKYYSGGYITTAAIHMGLINMDDRSYTTESKLLYIKLIPCSEEGYISSTRNGITSGSYSYSSGYYGFEFVTLDGKEIKAPSLDGVTTTSGENEITVTATTTAYNGASISKYYYNIDDNGYIESDKPYYTFKEQTPYVTHKIKVYARANDGTITEEKEVGAQTTKAIPTPSITVNAEGIEYNGEIWYPSGTIITLNYSEDMTNLTGYYQPVNVSSEAEEKWGYSGSSKTKIITLKESYTYRVKIQDKAGRESKVVEKKINIMPNPNTTNGVPSNYYKYNMGGIYPVYIKEGSYAQTTGIKGTDKYYSGGYITTATIHMGLLKTDSRNYTTESKLLYIKLIPCPEEGYISSTRNGITTGEYPNSTGYNGFEFVTLDGKEIKAPSLDGVTTTSGENEITVTATVTAYNGASISKYYYNIDDNGYIESDKPYYTFKEQTPYVTHKIKVYARANDETITEEKEAEAQTTKAIPTPSITINAEGIEYNEEIWYSYGTTITLNYSEDMTNLTGYCQPVNVSSGTEEKWQSNSSNRTRNITLYESYTYRVKIQDKAGRESKVVEKKINIMPNPNTTNGVPSNYYKYNMGGIYPVYIKEGSYAQTTGIKGTDKYYSGGYITTAAIHMGLINMDDRSYTTESKLLYIKLIPCPEEGYISSTRNGITSSSYNYSSGYNGFEFVTLDGTAIKGSLLDDVTSNNDN